MFRLNTAQLQSGQGLPDLIGPARYGHRGRRRVPEPRKRYQQGGKIGVQGSNARLDVGPRRPCTEGRFKLLRPQAHGHLPRG